MRYRISQDEEEDEEEENNPRKSSMLSDTSFDNTITEGGMICQERPVYTNTNESYLQNLHALRQYQRKNSQWGDEINMNEDTIQRSQGQSSNVYVIDDPDMLLNEESLEENRPFRPSNCTVIMNNRVSTYVPTMNRSRTIVSPQPYPKCSKESMLIMQDIDNLAEGSESYSHVSQEEQELNTSGSLLQPTMQLSGHSSWKSYSSLETSTPFLSRRTSRGPDLPPCITNSMFKH